EESRSAVRKQLQEVESESKKAEEQIVLLQGWFKKYADKEKVANQFEALLIHLDEAFLVKKEIQQTEEKIKSLQAKQTEQQKQLEVTVRSVREKEVIRQVTEEKIKEEETFLQAVSRDTAENEIRVTRKQREELLIEQARFVTTGNIAALRDKLIEGEPCPVCGNKEHPYASPAIHQQMDERNKQIAALTLRLGELDKVVQDYQKRQNQLAQFQQQLVQQEKELSQWRTRLAELENQGKVFLGQMETAHQLIEEQQKRLERSLQSTSALFGNDEWQTGWRTEPETFRNTLVAFTEGWNRKKEQLKEAEKQLEVCQSEMSFKKQLLQKEETGLQDLLKNYQEKQATADRLLENRSRLLEGKPAREVEEALNRSIENYRKQCEILQNIAREHATQVDQTKGVSGQIAKELEQAEQEWKGHSDKLQAWIEANNVSVEGFTIERESEQLTKQKAEYTFRLRTHAENQRKIAGFQKDLNDRREKYEQWAKLNELVGSADGGKFRRIAQGYTLDVLINYANVQLKNLTHRYRLERVPDTLALQVIDRDMCDEIRTVHSLSGGESFLVSLALALGLSSLSSNRMKVESLFIDEGFGSLDSDTLRVAMDALESLRTQGRKIGVISHVQEMTERIPVQIKVSRSGNGRSYLEITNPLTP
ncbi:MAG: ATP-dependent exonuclease, partial [Tannerellaceae bacterium]|nr:ATP-dependent exonuclease [Tannerellaceae bacterium]